MIPTLASSLPENTGDGYVAAAYIVFFVLLLIYLAIMALRLSHVQRDLRDLQARSSAEPPQPGGQAAPEQTVGVAPHEAEPETREREPA
ncbi:MAG: hypothetical protein WB709_04655 [Solirubrobacteraceae bacterium]